MKIDRYDKQHQCIWDEFVCASKNGTFLFLRDYMDYHEDRFDDYSLIIRSDGGDVVALLPAHAEGSRLVSHGGLTYGGYVVNAAMKTPTMLEVFEATAAHLRERSFTHWVYKTIPHIYHCHPAEEDRYALFLCRACLTRRDVLTVVDSRARPAIQQRRLRAIQKAQKNHLTTGEDGDYETFWQILEANLQTRFNAKPVHSLSEIRLLQARFPQNIRLFTSRQGDKLLGGVVIYESTRVAHVQYIASTEEGRMQGALDLLFHYLLTEPFGQKPYFDFGISNVDSSRRLNRGLIDQKEGFGARAVAHDFYMVALDDWKPGEIAGAMQ